MTHILCPLCGWNRSIKNYDPSNYERDLIFKVMKGKGRGKGFETIDEHSVLGDDVYSPIFARRVLDLLKMFCQFLAG